MADGLEFVDSVGHQSISQMSTKWTTIGGGSSIVSSVATGSTKAFRGFARCTLDASYDELRIGARHQINGIKYICGLENIPAGTIADVQILADGRFRVRMGQNGTSVTQDSSYSISFGARYFIEFYASCSPSLVSAGVYETDWTFELKINGVVRFSGSDTTGPGGFAGGITTVGQTKLVGFYISSDDSLGGWAGDIWVTETESLGDCLITPLYPRADGGTIQWTPLSGANWENVSEHPADDDTSYNSTSIVDDIDQFPLDAIGSFSGTIKGAQGVWRVKNAAPGSTEFKGLYDDGSTVVLTSPTWAPSDSDYQFFIDPQRFSVFTATDWTASEIDGMELGIKKTV